MSDNPQRLTRFDADGAREPMRHPQLVSLAYADHRRWAFYNIGAMMCAFDTGRVHGPFLPPCADCGAVVAYGGHNVDCPQDAPTFTPTDRQRRRIAGARAWIAQRLTVAYSGQLDTGTVHGPALPGKDPRSPFYRFARDCACGAVEIGFPHSWHAQDCARWGRA